MIKVNEDTELVKEIREAQKANGGYCCCAIIKDDTTKCMCQDFREQKEGWCNCGLYFKESV